MILTISGLADIEAAKSFAPELASALRCASLEFGYSLRPSDLAPTVATIAAYDGNWPAVFKTDLAARPFMATVHGCMSEHLVKLANQIDGSLGTGQATRLMDKPRLTVAVRLFSEVEFAGGETAKFIVLLSALEILIPTSPGGKRSRVRALVTKTLGDAHQDDAKEVGKRLEALYVARNELVHEARPVTVTQVKELSEIVRRTLRFLVREL